MKRRNFIAKDLFTSKFKKKVLKPKRVKEVLKEKKNNFILSLLFIFLIN